MRKEIDINTWIRKDHYMFFSAFEDPFFGVTVELDVTKAKKICKEKKWSFHQYYHFLSGKVINEIKELKTRIENNKIFVYDTIHISTTILKPNHLFAFTFNKMTSTFEEFSANAKKEFEKVKQAKGLGLTKNTAAIHTVHYSTVPWLNFTAIKHPLNFKGDKNGIPKITFGKVNSKYNKLFMPIAIYAHHGLVDGYHISLYISRFQELLNQ